jgi:hypothetical protein
VYVRTLLAIMILVLPLVSSAYSQSADLDSTLKKAQKSLDTKETENDPKQSSGLSDSGYKVYENLTYGVKVKYPVDWTPRHNVLDRISSPEILFDVAFFSLPENEIDTTSVSIHIEKLEPSSTTLQKYKARILANLKNSYPDIKEIITSKETIAGKPGYRMEYLINMVDHWEKSIDLESVSNGTLYEVSVLGKPEHIKKYSENIKKMIDSVEFMQPQVNFEQVFKGQVSNIKEQSSQPNRYVNQKCGVSIMLPKAWAATPSDFVSKDQSKTLADFQSADDDIFSLSIAIDKYGYYTLSPLDLSSNLRDFATLNPDSNIIESTIMQIGGFPSYKTVYSDGLPGRADRFYTFDTLIVAYDREYRFVFEAADKAEFDKYRSTVEIMAKSIRITQPNFEGIDC